MGLIRLVCGGGFGLPEGGVRRRGRWGEDREKIDRWDRGFYDGGCERERRGVAWVGGGGGKMKGDGRD